MSPTVYSFGNMKVMVRTKDHNPPHFHIVGPDVELKVEIGTWRIMKNSGFSEKAARKAIEHLKSVDIDFMGAWNEVHDKEN